LHFYIGDLKILAEILSSHCSRIKHNCWTVTKKAFSMKLGSVETLQMVSVW